MNDDNAGAATDADPYTNTDDDDGDDGVCDVGGDEMVRAMNAGLRP